VSTTEELLERKSNGSSLENREYGRRIRHADHVAPSIRKSWHQLRRQVLEFVSLFSKVAKINAVNIWGTNDPKQQNYRDAALSA
jgi:hypothetical protein